MKIALSWLARHLDHQSSVTDLAERLTALGLEVEEIDDPAARLNGFIVAEVLAAEQHPNADRLRVCTVAAGGTTPLQVVCGAPNARAGIKVVLAQPGMTVPQSGVVLKKSAIRGVESQGMLCSAKELLLGEDQSGIIELPSHAVVGAPAISALTASDPLITINLTPNRGDCAGLLGIARDLAAANMGALKTPATPTIKGAFACPTTVTLNPDCGCPHFAVRLIRGVKNVPSPEWLQKILLRIGLRPISALVDITNFFCFDQARPLHVFDADKIKGPLRLSTSLGTETLSALNGKDYNIPEGACIISDDSGVISLAGIVGGTSTSVDEQTQNVLLEAAWFTPTRIADTARKLQILSDARYRFERGVDPASTLPALEQATQMIIDICGGTPSDIFVAGTAPNFSRTISLNPQRCQTLAGLEVSAQDQTSILTALGFTVSTQNGLLQVQPPSWRMDIDGDADLIEEIVRVRGLNAIPTTPLPRILGEVKPALSLVQLRQQKARRILASRGLYECVTWSFMSYQAASQFAQIAPSLRLLNPISTELDTMRPSIIGNLAQAAQRNADRGYAHAALFELGPIYDNPSPSGQRLVATSVRQGEAKSREWYAAARMVDVFDAKADALALLNQLGINTDSLQITNDAPHYYHPARAGSLRQGQKTLAIFGELHPSTLKALNVTGPMVASEIFLEALPPSKSQNARPLLQLDSLQPVQRDFAFVLPANVPASKLLQAAKNADKALIKQVELFDLYAGKGLPDGHKSIAISITVQPREQPLTEADLQKISTTVIEAVRAATDAQLRS